MKLDQLLIEVQGDPLTRIFCLIIVAAAVLMVFVDFVQYIRRPSKQLDGVLSRVRPLLAELSTSDRLAESAAADLGPIQSLLVPHEAGGWRVEDGRLVAHAYPPSLAMEPPARWVQSAPALLTALGVIGTFLGITSGLIDFNTGAGPEQMQVQVTTLISSMKTAFLTSLVGLSLSSIAMILLAMRRAALGRTHGRMQREWDVLTMDAQEVRARDLLRALQHLGSPELREEQKEAANIQKQAADALSEAVGTLKGSLSGFNAERIGEHLRSGFENAISTQVVPVFASIQTEVGGVRQLLDRQEAIITGLTQQVHDSTDATRRASEAVSNLHNELGGIAVGLAGAAEKLERFQTQTLGSLNVFADKLTDTLQTFQSETRSILEGVAESMTGAVDQSVEAMQAQRSAFEASAHQASATFRGIRVDLEQALQTQASEQRTLLAETRTGVLSVLKEAQGTFDTQTETLAQTGREAHHLMGGARDALASTLRGIDTTLAQTHKTVERELDAFRVQYQSSLNTFFEKQNQLLEGTLGAQREGLHSVVRELHTVFSAEAERHVARQQALGDSFVRLTRSMKEVQDLSEALSATSSAGMVHVREAAVEIGRQSTQLGAQYDLMAEEFRASLVTGQQALAMYLRDAQAAYGGHFERMDQASERIHNRLLQTADYLALSEERRRSLAKGT